jgi:hypothetical protein
MSCNREPSASVSTTVSELLCAPRRLSRGAVNTAATASVGKRRGVLETTPRVVPSEVIEFANSKPYRRRTRQIVAPLSDAKLLLEKDKTVTNGDFS